VIFTVVEAEILMTRTEYMESICACLPRASHIAYQKVRFADGTLPPPGACHQNADRFAKENPGARVARGWVTYADFGLSTGLTAHSVTQGQDGQLFDITPLENERYRVGMQFVPHTGTEQEFVTMKELGIFIECPKK
jgi:hypothetical protein